MIITEFIKTYTPNYKERELEFIESSIIFEAELPLSKRLRIWRESLFPEAFYHYRVANGIEKTPNP